jgi:hypothetical protein
MFIGVVKSGIYDVAIMGKRLGRGTSVTLQKELGGKY